MVAQMIEARCSGSCDRHTPEQVASNAILHGCIHLIEKIERAIRESQGAVVLEYGEDRTPEFGYIALCEACIAILEQAAKGGVQKPLDLKRWPLRTSAKTPRVS